MLYNSPHHVSDIAQSHGWESLFLWQLTPNQDTPTVVAAPVVVRFESRELGQPGSGEREGEIGSSYQRIESNAGPDASVEVMPSVTEQKEDDPNMVMSENGRDKNRVNEESSSSRTTNENGGVPTIPTIAVTPDRGDPSTSHVLSPSVEEEEEELESGGRYRSRSKAIVNPSTQQNTTRPVSFSTNQGGSGRAILAVGGGVNRKQKGGGRGKRGSLTYSKCWDDDAMEESDDIWRACNIVTETLAYVLWRSTDNHADRPPWKVRNILPFFHMHAHTCACTYACRT